MITSELKTKKVSELMSRNILVGHKTNSFTHTLRLFNEMTFHHLPIVDSKENLIGIISSNDMLKVLTLKFPLLKDTKEETVNSEIDLFEVMTLSPQTISPDSTIQDALAIFSKYHMHALPVVGKKGLVGIITSNDVLAALNN